MDEVVCPGMCEVGMKLLLLIQTAAAMLAMSRGVLAIEGRKLQRPAQSMANRTQSCLK